MKTIHAIFENGVFRPTDPVSLPERCEVKLHVMHDFEKGSGTAGPSASDEPRLPIEDKLATLAAQVPRADWNRLPEDLTDKLDHYLYGTPEQ